MKEISTVNKSEEISATKYFESLREENKVINKNIISYLSTGGIMKINCLELTPSQISLLINELQQVKDMISLAKHHNYLQVIDSIDNIFLSIETQSLPVSSANFVQDLPCKYLGYQRNGKTSLWTRIKEAWRVLCDKPSHAFFTQEDGDFANGMFKDAVRVTFPIEKIFSISSQAYSCRIQSNYFIPSQRFIPAQFTKGFTILKMFAMLNEHIGINRVRDVKG